MLKEFKEFALRGNLVDLAIGFIIVTCPRIFGPSIS